MDDRCPAPWDESRRFLPFADLPLPPGEEGQGLLGEVLGAADSGGACGCGCAGGCAEAQATDLGGDEPPEAWAQDGFEADSAGLVAWDDDAAAAPLSLDELESAALADPSGEPSMAPALEAPGSALSAGLFAKLREQVTQDLLGLWGPRPRECREVGSGGRSDEDFFGDGSDGDLDTAVTQDPQRDTFYENLTIRSTGRFLLRQRLFVKGKLTIEAGGSVDIDGGNGGDAAGGASGGGGDPADGNLSSPWRPRSGRGGSGGTPGGAGTATGTAGGAGTGQAAFQSFGPLAYLSACGGGGGAYCGLAAGATEAETGTASIGPNGGAGGAATNDGTSVTLGGGGGGGGAGAGIIYANEVDNAGRISANGGNGGKGDVSGANKGGAGGGAGGGAIILYYAKTSGSGLGTVQANGGAAGTAGGAASAGSAGVARTIQVNV